MPSSVGVVLVGTGFATEHLHLPQLAKIPQVRLVAIVSRNMNRARLLAKQFGVEACYTDLEQALKREDVQVVDVNVPTFLHKENVIRAAEAGKHVLCEKPMAGTLREADEMIDAARKAGTKLMIGHVLRFVPEYLKAKELADADYLGDVVAARAIRIRVQDILGKACRRKREILPIGKLRQPRVAAYLTFRFMILTISDFSSTRRSRPFVRSAVGWQEKQ